MSIILSILSSFLRLYSYVMLFYCIMSWFPSISGSQIGQLVRNLCEPVLQPIRNVLSRFIRSSMFDWSPLVAFLLIDILSGIINRL